MINDMNGMMINARARSWIGSWPSWKCARLFGWMPVLLVFLALPARSEESWVGKRVIQKDAHFQLQVGSKVVDLRGNIEIYRVEQVHDSWLWLHSDQGDLTGWTRTDQVVPLDDAIPFFTGEIHEKTDDPLPYVLRAKVWESKNELDIAVGDLNDAIRLDPTHAWVYNWRGILWREKKEYEKAIADHTEAIKLEPGNSLSYVNRALALLDAKQYDKAIDDFNQAIRFDPENARNFNKRGWTRYCMGDYDKAIADFDQALGLDPQLEDAYTNRGMTWFAKNDQNKAIEDFSHALKLDPADGVTYNDRGWAWEQKNEHDRAIADFDQALRFKPDFARAYTNRGIAWAAKKDFDKAIENFDHALQIDPHRPRPYTNRGIALAAKGEFDRAIADFNQAVRLQPDAIWPRYNRLLALLSSGRQEASTEARNLLERIGWSNELSAHTSLIGYFAALRNGKPAEAELFLTNAATHCNPKQWTYSVIRFLRGKIGEQQLLALATDASRKTEIHSFIGLRDSLRGRPEQALPHLRWVKGNGVSSDAEYPIALAELDRIEGKRKE